MRKSILTFLKAMVIPMMLGITAQAQPTLVTEIPEASTNFVTAGDFVYFTSNDSLLRTDGTSQGTIFLRSGFSRMLSQETDFNGMLFFVVGDQLWRSDGTPGGTMLLMTRNGLDILEGVGTSLFFRASDAATGIELYRTNGTATGTTLVKDINPGPGDGFLGNFAVMGGNLFFRGDDGVNGSELWKSDGTAAGTLMIVDLNSGAADGMGGGGFSLNGLFYFRGNNGETGWEPWVSNGTAGGTSMLKEIVAGTEGVGGIQYEIANDGSVYFLVWPGPQDQSTAPDLWRSSGTTASTLKVKTLGYPEDQDTFDGFLIYENEVYFHQRHANFSHILWKSDGTPEGTHDFYSLDDTWNDGITFFDVVKDHLLFTGISQGYPFPLHRHNGTETEIFYRFKSGGFTGSDRNITAPHIEKSGNLAFFADHEGSINDGGHPSSEEDYFQLYQTDGVTTQSMRALYGVNITGVKEISDLNGKVIFTTHDDYFAPGEDFQKLWIYDPSAPANTGAGKLSVETWNGVPGTDVSSIPVSSPPSSTSEIAIFETPKNIGDNYGSRVRGYVIPPATGNYTFWIASDDRSELWLSTDATPANKRRIASVAGWTNSRQWDKYTGQTSAPVSLVAGRKYYVEALLKEGTGGDHLAVGWQLPDATMERPIPGSRLAAFGSDETPPEPCAGTGMIRQEFWTNVPGTRVSNIPVNEEPDFTQDLTIFEGPASSVGDNYGSRIRGYICPPASGAYTFWIAGDDQVELSLSTDDNPANKRRIAYHTGWTNKREWTKYATQQSASITLQAGRRYYVEALMKEGTGGDHVSVGWQLPDGALQRPIAGAHLIPFGESPPPPACAGTGTISVETWTGIDGTQVSSIPVNSTPTLTGERNIFEAPTNIGNNFGSRFRGYVCVPTSGNYTFWIASDDHSELWLSTDADPANKRRIAYHTGWTSPRQWTKYATQQSAPVSLVAGQQYYIEALYKEDEGGDNMAVGWQLPDGTMERPIPGSRLSPFAEASATIASQSITSEERLYEQLSVYPNPAKSGDPELTISGYESIDRTIETDIEIMSMTGEVVFADRISCGGNCGSYLMNVNKQLVPGVYMVNMKTDGVRTSKRLLVK
jgi:ELWxxDGT repeat protein